MPVKAKRTGYEIVIDREGRLRLPGGEPAHLPPDWSSEHLVLAALARCTLAALVYHGRRAELWVAADARATGTVTRRADGSWGFVEIGCDVDARLDPALEGDRLAELLVRAEQGCFVGQSLDPRPAYTWRVNGADVSARAAPS